MVISNSLCDRVGLELLSFMSLSPTAKTSHVCHPVWFTHYFEAVHSASSKKKKNECMVGTSLDLNVDIDSLGVGEGLDCICKLIECLLIASTF